MTDSEIFEQFEKYCAFQASNEKQSRCLPANKTDEMRTTFRSGCDPLALLNGNDSEFSSKVDFVSEVISAPREHLPPHKESPLERTHAKSIVALCIAFVAKGNYPDKQRSIYEVQALLNAPDFGKSLNKMASCDDLAINYFLQRVSIKPEDQPEHFSICQTWALKMVTAVLAV